MRLRAMCSDRLQRILLRRYATIWGTVLCNLGRWNEAAGMRPSKTFYGACFTVL